MCIAGDIIEHMFDEKVIVQSCWVLDSVSMPDGAELPDPPAWLDEMPVSETPSFPDDVAGFGWQLDDAQLLQRIIDVEQILAFVQAQRLALIAEADRRNSTLVVASLTTASWLAASPAHSPREARADVALARKLDAAPPVAAAFGRGRVSQEQAAAIVSGLERLPEELCRAEVDAVAAHLVELAAEFNPPALRRLVDRAVEVVASQVAEEADRRALDRAERLQQRDRYLSWKRQADGSVGFHGSLPAVEGELLINHLGDLGRRLRAADALAGVETSRPQAQADALAQVLAHHAGCEGGAIGGDWARVVVNVDLDDLTTDTGRVTLVASGEPVSLSEARRLACAGGVLPAVLGRSSLPLDLGRARRLFTPAQRLAIALRDGGAPSRAAIAHPVTPSVTTFIPGGPGEPPTCRTESCSARTTITWWSPTCGDHPMNAGRSASTPWVIQSSSAPLGRAESASNGSTPASGSDLPRWVISAYGRAS